MVENNTECKTYNTASEKSQYGILRGFKGVPLTIIVNSIGLLCCVCIHITWRGVVHFLRSKGRNIPSIADVVSNAESKMRIRDYFWTSDALYEKRAGLNALLYLRALRISMLQLITLIPIFFAGLCTYSSAGVVASFDSMALSAIDLNVSQNNILLWIAHAVTCVAYLLVTTLRYRYVHLIHEKCLERSCYSDLVLLLSGVFDQTNVEIKSSLEEFISNNKQSINVMWCYAVQDLAKLTRLEISRSRFQALLKHSKNESELYGLDPMYWKCSCCVGSGSVPTSNAIQVYTERIEKLNSKMENEMLRLKLLPKAGIELNNASCSGLILICLRCETSKLRQVVNVLNLKNMFLQTGLKQLTKSFDASRTPFEETKFILHPFELFWNNVMTVQYKTCCWWLNVFLVRIVLFAMALLLTSPTYLFYAFNYYSLIKHTDEQYVTVLFNWLPAFTLMASTSLVPVLVTSSERMIKHFTYNEREKRGILVLYIFLFITVVIFPSLGMASLPIAVAHLIDLVNTSSIDLQHVLSTLKFKCVFAPDTSGLFVNYVITGSLLSIGVELLQVGRWFLFFFWRIFTIHSNSEAEMFAKYEYYPFPFRENYAMTMLVQTIVSAYAPINPAIIPFGFFYFCTKYMMHKYLLSRIYPAPRLLSVTDESWCFIDEPVGDKRVGHVDWFVVSTHLSLVGICALALNIGIFYTFKASKNQLRAPVLAFGILTILVLLAAVLMICWTRVSFRSLVWRNINTEKLVNLKFFSTEMFKRSKQLDDEWEPEVDVSKADTTCYMPPVLQRLKSSSELILATNAA